MQLEVMLFTMMTTVVATVILVLYKKWCSTKVTIQPDVCEDPPNLPHRLLLGFDRLHEIYQADKDGWLMDFFTHHFRLWGSTLHQRFLDKDAIGTIDPQNIQALLSTTFNDWSMGLREQAMAPLFGAGIFTQSGAAWKVQREMARGLLTHQRYDDCHIFDAPVALLLRDLSDVESNYTIDLQPLLLKLTLETTLSLLFGKIAGDDQPPRQFSDAFDTAQSTLAKRMRLQDWYWLIGYRKFHRSCNIVRDYVDYLLNKYPPMLESNDRKLVRDQIINLLVAGRDTTASLISWTLYLLARYLDKLSRLRGELNAEFKMNNSINRKSLQSCLYLQCVLREVLRLYPPILVNSRTAVRDSILPVGGGPALSKPVFVRKGTIVSYSVYALHRRPDLWGEDAEIFRPERWDRDVVAQNETNHKWGYLPFNGGPRLCLGMDFALTEAAYCITKIVREFPEMHLPSGQQAWELEKQTMGLVMFRRDGCRLRLRVNPIGN